MATHSSVFQRSEEGLAHSGSPDFFVPPVLPWLAGAGLAGLLTWLVIGEAALRLLQLPTWGAIAFGLALGVYVFVIGLLLALVATGMLSDERAWGTVDQTEPAQPATPKPTDEK